MKPGIVFAVFGLAMVLFASELVQNRAKATFAAEPPACVDAFEGLVSWWPGDFDADDIVGANAGLRFNGASIQPAFVRGGFTFDGKDDYVSVADSDSLNVVGGLTLNVWVYWEGFTDSDLESVIVSKPGSFELGIRNFGGPQLYLHLDQVGDRETNLSSEDNYFPLRRWVYLSVTYDEVYGELTIAVDGTPFAEMTLFDRGSISPTESDLTFGARDGDSHFKGQLDEIELYNRGLSRAEVEMLIATRETGKCSGSLEVEVVVVPGWWEQTFDVIVNGEVKADDLAGGGSTGKLRVTPGYQTISRTDGEGYYLQGTVTAWECRNDLDHVIRWWKGHTLAELPVLNGESVICTMTIYESGCDGAAFENVIIGDNADNVLTGTEGRDVILGLGGDDEINGLEGDDCLVGGPGDDLVIGGGGDDEYHNDIGNPPPPPPPAIVAGPAPVEELPPAEEPAAE